MDKLRIGWGIRAMRYHKRRLKKRRDDVTERGRRREKWREGEGERKRG